MAPDLSALASSLPTYATRLQASVDAMLAGNPQLAQAVNNLFPSVEAVLGGAETAWCPAEHVVRARERRTRTPTPPGRWPLRLRVAPG